MNSQTWEYQVNSRAGISEVELFDVVGFHCNAFIVDSLVWDDALCGLAFFPPVEELGRLIPAVWGLTFCTKGGRVQLESMTIFLQYITKSFLS